jgi:hypothetical protein
MQPSSSIGERIGAAQMTNCCFYHKIPYHCTYSYFLLIDQTIITDLLQVNNHVSETNFI